ncbi:DUF433 domain-containing protein [Prosthecodimorpha staleyi]|uniref:DUF433 domain-containing protein n=1 Tax=Prosthecodimorpha staleyi TaxID=2840188 RepID=A0A947GFE5_9HYPH|nr:DUF433 domain-containing protein [Prosthecodimorpha staleyi]MBT9290480.1 DUF433 domain-containing protein [Prosthecodimorpha staleyi]
MSNRSAHGVVSAFTEEQASRLTGLSVHQLRYWDRTGFFRPQFADPNRRAAFSRVYSFQDIASLRVLNVLTKQYSVSVRHLRDVAKRLCAMDSNAWSRTTLYVLKRRVNFVDPEDGKQREVVSGQYALGIPLETVMSDTRRDVEALSVRSIEDIGAVARSRFVASNMPVVAGTRIPVAAIKSFAEAGYSLAQIMQEYPTLSEADIKAAVSFDTQTKAA